MDSLKMSNNSISNTKSTNSSTIIRIIYISFIIFIILFLIYVIVAYYNYSSVYCYEKKRFIDYLFSTNRNICVLFDKPAPKYASKIKQDVSLIKKDITKDITNMGNFLQNKEVYHISNQDYSYDQSKCKCSSYGGRLATKNEVTNAYNKGANWCSYGWTEGQTAYYPVQKCYHDSIMEEDDFLENSDKYCGKPGMNGGYFSNPQLKFGINCYGVKPKGSVVKEKSPYCAPKEFCKLNKNINSSHKLSTDEISPFNNTKWNI